MAATADVTETIPLDDDRTIEADFTATETNYGASVTGIEWSIESGSDYGSLGAPSTVGAVSVALLTSGALRGTILIRAQATFSDSQKASLFYRIAVDNPKI